MDMTNKEYGQYVNAKSKPSPLGRDMLWAFVVGGLICTVGQALLNLYQNAGMGRDDAGSAVSMTLIFAAALLTGLGLFDKLAKRAGAGTLVPITGFANAMVSPALEFRREGLVLGLGAGKGLQLATGAKSGLVNEMLSVPAQQLARVYALHGTEDPVGYEIIEKLSQRGIPVVYSGQNIGDRFVTHGSLPELYHALSLDTASIVRRAEEVVRREK